MSVMRFLDDELAGAVRTKLISLQGERSDAAFARLLGVSRPHWWNVKHGRRRASYALVKRASAHFPALTNLVIHDMSAAAS